ncbi:hypothetical protein AAG570_008340 [Ranatra chinensis]|uniref:BHLH domain-containing protein n=1 Tax=Ranatra chinensis TaxID=642074 RepID=A0ABD0Y866_9HEMI
MCPFCLYSPSGSVTNVWLLSTCYSSLCKFYVSKFTTKKHTNVSESEDSGERYYWSEETGWREQNSTYQTEVDAYYRPQEDTSWPTGPQLGANHQPFGPHPTPVVRVVKRRNTANKKERRRTQSINNAFADLRDCIPNVPADTKLSKIKTLRLATSYIAYLMAVLESGSTPTHTFNAQLVSHPRRHVDHTFQVDGDRKKGKGRTGWPQHVWALELKQESL